MRERPPNPRGESGYARERAGPEEARAVTEGSVAGTRKKRYGAILRIKLGLPTATRAFSAITYYQLPVASLRSSACR
jgi:hypothetical protein